MKRSSEKRAHPSDLLGRGKTAKRVMGLLLACAMAFPMLFSAVACEFVVHKDPNGDLVVTPGDDTNKDPNQQGNQQGGQQNTPSEPETPDYSMYSGILQTVLTSEYYNDLQKKAANSELDHYINGMPPADLGKNLIEAIPYKFLQNEGADIENIQLDRIYVSTMSYTANQKELYLRVDIQEPNQTVPYITQYLLKYQIDEKEYNDLVMLNKNEYIQAGFFIQELDNQRTPELVSKFNIKQESYEKILERLPSSKKLSDSLGSNKLDNFTVTNCTTDGKDFVLDLMIIKKRNNSGQSLYTSKIATMKLVVYDDALPSYTDHIFALERFSYLYDREVGEVQTITCFMAYPNIIWNKNFFEKK